MFTKTGSTMWSMKHNSMPSFNIKSTQTSRPTESNLHGGDKSEKSFVWENEFFLLKTRKFDYRLHNILHNGTHQTSLQSSPHPQNHFSMILSNIILQSTPRSFPWRPSDYNFASVCFSHFYYKESSASIFLISTIKNLPQVFFSFLL